ncbi:Hypothetical_protein [Hexamita inflata]|uniref:Hypothetical_protein n=1 Tax=Hexamita inflata TaxID=28002 RepID=A0ABP1HH46_9EUKA
MIFQGINMYYLVALNADLGQLLHSSQCVNIYDLVEAQINNLQSFQPSDTIYAAYFVYAQIQFNQLHLPNPFYVLQAAVVYLQLQNVIRNVFELDSEAETNFKFFNRKILNERKRVELSVKAKAQRTLFNFVLVLANQIQVV